MKKKIEILAPAKDLLHGMAAINSGADAVYIGAPQFGLVLHNLVRVPMLTTLWKMWRLWYNMHICITPKFL
ncbi:MAG: hypothetical protein RL074_1187 [Bacteroidota bacterium]